MRCVPLLFVSIGHLTKRSYYRGYRESDEGMENEQRVGIYLEGSDRRHIEMS
jgi:hypothetical protein